MPSHSPAKLDSRPSVFLVTYEAMPNLSPDDRALQAALEEVGISANPAVWNDPNVEWEKAQAAIVRSVWDYFLHPEEFRRWIDNVSERTQLINSPELIRWNMHKGYLDELSEAGIPTVPTVMLKASSDWSSLHSALEGGWDHIVIKPAVSGSAFKTKVFERNSAWDFALLKEHASDIHLITDAMVQQFIPSVYTEGERSLVYLGGSYSHAFKKAPFSAGAAGGESRETVLVPTNDELAFCESTLSKLPSSTAYARVDIIPHDGTLRLMELELIEPALHFRLCPGSAQRLAKVLSQTILCGMRLASPVARNV